MTTTEQQKMKLPKAFAVENMGEEEKEVSDPECLAPTLPPGPEHTDLEDIGEDVVNTPDLKAPTPPPCDYGVCAVEEGKEERRALY